MKILGVSGIWSDGSGSTDIVLTLLRYKHGYPIQDIQNKTRGPFFARFKAKRDARKILEKSQDGDIVVAHSYGCLKTLKAAEKKSYSHLFLIAPAASEDYDFSKISERTKIHCLYSKKDWAVRVGSLLLFHPFGRAGLNGFSDPRVENHRFHGGHTHYFKEDILHQVVNLIHKTLEKDNGSF